MKRNIHLRLLLAFILLIFVLSLTACKWEQKRELSRNREKWQTQNLTEYRYKVSIISYWGENVLMPLTMFYRNGQLDSVLDRDGNIQESYWDTMGGIDAIFQEAEDALARRGREIEEIRYDPIYGFPTYIDIFYNERGVGSEYNRHYTVSDFEVLPSP